MQNRRLSARRGLTLAILASVVSTMCVTWSADGAKLCKACGAIDIAIAVSVDKVAHRLPNLSKAREGALSAACAVGL